MSIWSLVKVLTDYALLSDFSCLISTVYAFMIIADEGRGKLFTRGGGGGSGGKFFESFHALRVISTRRLLRGSYFCAISLAFL